MSITGKNEVRSFAAGDIIAQSDAWVWTFPKEQHEKFCAHCIKPASDLKTCSKCKLYRYCNQTCQKLSWQKDHKGECDMLKRFCECIALPENRLILRAAKMIDKSGEFGLWTFELLLLKILYKLQRNVRDSFPALGGTKSVSEILQLLPDIPERGSDITSGLSSYIYRLAIVTLGFPVETLAFSENDLLRYYGKVWYNAKRICGLVSHVSYPFGNGPAGIYPDINFRNMTNVCLDSNVSISFNGRLLRVHAIQDIPVYHGLKDCRWDGSLSEPYNHTLNQRRELHRRASGQACNCPRCTEDYDAELNPLKCITPGCMERIPSDTRALEACKQCGALNESGLHKYQQLIARQEGILARKPENELHPKELALIKIHLLAELDDANLVHPDAHMRYIYGRDAADHYFYQQEHKKAWPIYESVLPCVRIIFPDYHSQRAIHLHHVGIQWHKWYHLVLNYDEIDPSGACEALVELSKIFPQAIDFLKESYDIFVKMFSEQSAVSQLFAQRLTEAEEALSALSKIFPQIIDFLEKSHDISVAMYSKESEGAKLTANCLDDAKEAHQRFQKKVKFRGMKEELQPSGNP